MLAAYAGALWPPLGGPATIVVTLAAITLINVAGIKRAIGALGGLTLLKLAPLLLLILLGLGIGRSRCRRRSCPSSARSRGSRWSRSMPSSGSRRRPSRRRDPRSAPRHPARLAATVAGVTLLYVLIQLAYSASGLGASDTPLADLAARSLGPAGTLLLGLTAIVSVLANQLSSMASVPRLTSSLADEGLLPRWFGHVSPASRPRRIRSSLMARSAWRSRFRALS